MVPASGLFWPGLGQDSSLGPTYTRMNNPNKQSNHSYRQLLVRRVRALGREVRHIPDRYVLSLAFTFALIGIGTYLMVTGVVVSGFMLFFLGSGGVFVMLFNLWLFRQKP